MIENVWQAQPGSQDLFLRCPLREVCYSGTRGPGKTDAMLMAFAQHCGKGYGAHWRGVIFRKEYKHLDDIITKSKRWFNQFTRYRPKFLASQGALKWVWPDGEELLFRVFASPDDYWSYHGHEYPFIGWEELTSWPNIDCYESMMSCNRTSRPGGLPLQVRSTTNPYGVGHNWVKAYFIDPAPYGIPILNSEGQARVCLFGSVNENRYLDAEYIKTLNAITDPNKRKAWLYGSWDITSGGMFDDLWNREKHVLPVFNIPASWRLDRAFDWGSSRPFSVGWWAESDGIPATIAGKETHFPRGTLIRVNEWYGCTGKPNEGLRMTANNVANGIVEREKAMGLKFRPGPADSAIYAVTDDISIGQNMEKAGVRWVPADKKPGSRKNGWELIRGRMEAVIEGYDKPGIYVTENCRDFIRTVPTLPRDSRDPDDIDCFVAGTMISTPVGDVPIERVAAGDFVNTPIGPRAVTKAGISGRTRTVRVLFSDGTVLEGTPDHKIYVEGIGLQPLCRLSLGQIVATKESTSWLKRKLIWASFSGATKAEIILNAARGTQPDLEAACYTVSYGSASAARYLKGFMFTTKTTTRPTTALTTFNWWLRQIMRDTTSKQDLRPTAISEKDCKDGVRATRDSQCFAKILRSAVRTLPSENLRALIVASLLAPGILRRSTARQNAASSPDGLEQKEKSAWYAAKKFLSKLAPKKKPGLAVMHVAGSYDVKDVFNLTVEQAHLFFANGVLATNTEAEDHIADETRYRCLATSSGPMSINLGVATNG